MASAENQRTWRANDPKHTVEVRLSPQVLARLDKLAVHFGARGRAEVIERLLMADPGQRPDILLNEAIRLGRAYLRATGRIDVAVRDAAGDVYCMTRE